MGNFAHYGKKEDVTLSGKVKGKKLLFLNEIKEWKI